MFLTCSKKNRKKEKQKTPVNHDGVVQSEGESIALQNIRIAMELINFQQKPAKTAEEAVHKQYQFWSTQPVPKMGKLIDSCNLFKITLI